MCDQMRWLTDEPKPRLWMCAFWYSGESVTRHLADIGPWRVPKSGHVTITKIGNLHIDTRRKIHWFQKCYLFDLRQKITKLSRKNRFRTVHGVTGRLWTLIGRLEYWRSSSIYPSSYIYISVVCRITMRREEFLTNFYHCDIRTMLNCTWGEFIGLGRG